MSAAGKAVKGLGAAAEFAQKAYNELLDFVGYNPTAGDIEAALPELSKETRNIVKALQRDDNLGFENPNSALAEIINRPDETIANFDISPQLKSALTKNAYSPKPKKTMDDVAPRIGGSSGSNINQNWLRGRGVLDLVSEGYPESVSQRIVSGKLDMNEPARRAREDTFGLDAYHLTNKDFNQFKTGTDVGPMGWGGTSGDAVWLGATPQQRYPAAHNVYQPTNEEELLKVIQAMEVKPEHKAIGSNVMPLKLKSDEALSIDEFNLKEMQDRYADGDIEFPWMVSPEAADKLRKGGYDSIYNEVGMWDDGWTPDQAELISLFPENIRSKYAAFDPEYTGPSILGSRVVPTAGAGILGQILGGDEEMY